MGILPGFMVAFFLFLASFAFEGSIRWIIRLVALGVLVLPFLKLAMELPTL